MSHPRALPEHTSYRNLALKLQQISTFTITRPQIRRMFTRADRNKDGKLTQEEWLSVLNSSGVPTTREEVEEFFASMDRDYDGRLTFEEFMGEESTIEKLFKNMDKNGDGVVTKEVGVTADLGLVTWLQGVL